MFGKLRVYFVDVAWTARTRMAARATSHIISAAHDLIQASKTTREGRHVCLDYCVYISWTSPGLPARVFPARVASHRISAAHDLIQASKPTREGHHVGLDYCVYISWTLPELPVRVWLRALPAIE